MSTDDKIHYLHPPTALLQPEAPKAAVGANRSVGSVGVSSSMNARAVSAVDSLRQRVDHLESEMVRALRDLESKLDARSGRLALSPELSQALTQLELRMRKELTNLRLVGGLPTAEAGQLGDEIADNINGIISRVEQTLSPEDYSKKLHSLRMSFRSVELDEYGFDAVLASRLQPVFNFLFNKYFRVDVVGIENIPDEGRAMLVGNHSGTVPYDGLMLAQAVAARHPRRRQVRTLAEDFISHFPFLGVALNRLGHVRASQENAERMLRQDRLVAVFPEGLHGIGKTFDKRYQLQRFGRGGFVKLALRTGTPLIPVSIIGAEETHPLLGRWTWLVKHLGVPFLPITPTFPWLGLAGAIPLPTKWTITIGKPIDLSRYKPEAADDRLLVNRITENVRTHIQSMVTEGLAARRSLWWG